MAKNYNTYYLGTGGLVVSKSPVETDRAWREKEQVRKLMEITKAYDLLEFKKKQMTDKMPRPLVRGGMVNLLELDTLGNRTIAAYAQGMLTALQKLQAKEITLSGRNDNGSAYSTAADIDNNAESNVQILADVKAFVEALSRMEKTFNNAAAKGSISKTAWEGIRRHVYVTPGRGREGPDQQLFAAMERILKGKSSTEDLARVFNSIRGDFGNHLGTLMEDLIRYMVESPQIEEKIKKQVADVVVNTVKGNKSYRALGKDAALPGTIRATLVGASYQSEPTRKKQVTTGKRLRDASITVTTGPDGGKITWGISSKQYNFHSAKNSKGEIKIAELSLQNFADVFARIRRSTDDQRRDSRGNNALYAYRLLGADKGEKNSPVLLYLLSHRVAEVAFGSNIGSMTGDDTAELMVINGRMMNTADVLEMGTLNVTTAGFPKQIGGGWWAPEKTALDNVDAIHKAKLMTYIEFGKARAIEAFG